MATKPKKTTLPKRFQPLAGQAATETDLRYGAQEDALKQIFGTTTRDYQRRAQAQDAADRSLLGSLQSAGVDLTRVYSDAGLSPSVLATIANSPTGQRLGGELARQQAAIQQQQLGAQAGGVYQQQHIGDQYREDVGAINAQAKSLAKERGLYESSLLDQLISGDRTARHDANVHVRDQQFQADQNLIDNTQSQTNALIGAGVDPSDPTKTLPGHGPKPKPKPRATPGEQATAASDFAQALDHAQIMVKSGTPLPRVVKDLTMGQKARPGKVVYEDVPVTDQFGNVIKGKFKRQPKIDPNTGTVVTTGATDAVDPVNPAVAMAAAEMAAVGYVSPKTVKELHRLGYAVRGLPDLKTTFDRPRRPAPYPVGRPGTAPGSVTGRGQQRPT